MKTPLLLCALLGSHAFAEGEGFVNFIRQDQQTTGVVWSMPVTPRGGAPSVGLLEEGGALFQLWTVEQATGKDYLLDQKLVGAYLPAAAIEITTLDPYSRVPRTRADQPFTVTVHVDGLLTGANLPDAATRVLLEHHLAPFSPGKSAVTPAQAVSNAPDSSAFLGNDGETLLRFPVTSLPSADPTLARGEEHFVVHALGDGSISQTQLASAFVEIWPVASGAIAGLNNGATIRYNAPPLTITLKDLYPRSDSWLQVYEGAPKLNSDGTTVSGSKLVLDQDESADRVLTLASYDSVFPEDGTYTLELLTRTPFGIDRLHYITVQVNRTLEIRAQLNGFDER